MRIRGVDNHVAALDQKSAFRRQAIHPPHEPARRFAHGGHPHDYLYFLTKPDPIPEIDFHVHAGHVTGEIRRQTDTPTQLVLDFLHPPKRDREVVVASGIGIGPLQSAPSDDLGPRDVLDRAHLASLEPRGPDDPSAPTLRIVIIALCFIHVTPDLINTAGQAIAEIDGVDAAYSVTGDIDLIALIKVIDHEGVAKVVTDGISKVPGVTATQTHISFRTYSQRDIEAGFSIGS